MFGNHGLCGLLEEGAHEKSPKCLGWKFRGFWGTLQRSHIVNGYIDAKTDAAGEEVSSEFDFKVLVSENGNSLSRADRRYMPIYGKCDAEYFKARNNDDYVEEYVKKKIVFL